MLPFQLDDLLVFIGLMALLFTIGKVALALINRRKGVDTSAIDHHLSDLNKRLERLEQTVDSTALEVERISEGQRFTTKLLAEKAPIRSES